MKVLHVIDTLSVGGAERVCIDLANLFAEKGHQVGILTISKEGPFKDYIGEDIEYTFLNRGSNKYSLQKLFALSKILRKYDIIHVHMRHTLKYIFLCKSIFSLKTPVYFHDHYGKIKVDKSIDTFLRIALKSVNHYIGVSQELCDWAFEKGNIPKKRISILSNIIRRAKIAEAPKGRNLGAFRGIIVGNLHPIKNIEFAIDLIAEVNKSSQRKISLDIYGKVHNEEYYQSLVNSINMANAENDIKFVFDCNDIQKVLKNYDFALHTAKSETGPLVTMEYLSQSLPFLVHETGQVVEQIKPFLPELIIDNFEMSVWSSALEGLFINIEKEQLPDLEEVFEKLFSEDSYYSQCLQIYKK